MTAETPALKMIREFVAVGRATFERPHTAEGDPDAQRRIVEGIEVLDEAGARIDVGGALVDLLAPRAPFFDGCVLDAIAAGVTQVVNLGSGYDDRALRFTQAGVRFFEVDLPHVVADKARRLETVDAHHLPILIPADLAVADISALLVEAGLDADKPTLFVCEHVLLFMGRNEVQRLFAGLSQIAAPTSTLALSVETHAEGIDTDLVIATVDDVMFSRAKVVRSIRSRADWIAGLDKTGWKAEESTRDIVVDHFEVLIAEQTVQIQTRFLKAVSL